MLSEVPEGWQQAPLSELLEVMRNGFSCKQEKSQLEGSVPVSRIETISTGCIDASRVGYVPYDEKLERYRIEKGDILFSHINSVEHIAKIAFAEEAQNFFHAMNLLLLRADSKRIIPHYLAEVLRWQRTRSYFREHCKRAVNQVSLNQKNIGGYELSLPPLNEQHRIAEILSSVDASIQATQAVIKQAERVKRGLMEELLTGGLGSEAIERGEVPDGWRRAAIGSLCKVVTGKTPSTKNEEYWDGAVPFFTPADLSEAATVTYAERTVTEQAVKAGAKLLPANSILYTCIGSTIGKLAITAVECCTNQQINACVANEGVDYRFLYFQLLMAESVVKSLSSTTAVPIINKTTFSSIEVVFPALEEQRRIANKLESFDFVIEKERAIIEQLNHTKRGLMDDLLTGKVRAV